MAYKTRAYLVQCGNLVGYTYTTASNGTMVPFGEKMTDAFGKVSLLQHGKAKVSRAKKWKNEDYLAEYYDVNYSDDLKTFAGTPEQKQKAKFQRVVKKFGDMAITHNQILWQLEAGCTQEEANAYALQLLAN